MKKFLKITAINILLTFFILLCFELFLCIDKNVSNYKGSLYNKIKVYYIKKNKYFDLDEFRNNTKENDNLSNLQAPIILMGCSFTYGNTLKNNETFSTQLEKYTNKPVYNWGIPGGSPKEMLYILRNNEIMQDLKVPNVSPQYVIYTFIDDHIERLYKIVRPLTPNYIDINNELIYIPKTFINYSYLIRTVTGYLQKNILHKHSIKLFYLYMTQINKEIKKVFGENTKFVIFVYIDTEDIDWNILRNEQITVINANDIFNIDLDSPEYIADDNVHPNAKAWEVIVPVLAKELNL